MKNLFSSLKIKSSNSIQKQSFLNVFSDSRNSTGRSLIELPRNSIFTNNNINPTMNKTHNFSRKNFSKINYTYDTRDFLNKISDYEKNIDDLNVVYTYENTPLKGFATGEGTKRFANRNKEEVHKDHFRQIYDSDIIVSSMGLGSYMGAPDDINDFYIYNAVKTCILSGAINIIDTAINYRYMKSEKVIGKALNALSKKYGINREELFISSKMGYVPEDAANGKRAHSFVQDLIESKKMELDDVIFDEKNRPIHCMHPEFLKEQLKLSLENLGLETLDLMYLHNVFEAQGAIVTPELFEKRLKQAFEFMVIYIKFFLYFLITIALYTIVYCKCMYYI